MSLDIPNNQRRLAFIHQLDTKNAFDNDDQRRSIYDNNDQGRSIH